MLWHRRIPPRSSSPTEGQLGGPPRSRSYQMVLGYWVCLSGVFLATAVLSLLAIGRWSYSMCRVNGMYSSSFLTVQQFCPLCSGPAHGLISPLHHWDPPLVGLLWLPPWTCYQAAPLSSDARRKAAICPRLFCPDLGFMVQGVSSLAMVFPAPARHTVLPSALVQ